MATAKLTLIGLHNYSEGDIWDGLKLPAYFNKTTAINTILLKCGEFEVMYPSVDVLKSFIGVWSVKYQRFFTRLAAVMAENYLPLANYDKHEEWTDNTTSAGSGESSSESSDSGTTGNTSTGQVSAFNATTFQDRDKTIDSGNSSNTGTTSGEFSNQTSIDGTHDGHIYGNIGVMTTQKILKEEISVSAISPYDVIADVFSNEFCVKVYV